MAKRDRDRRERVIEDAGRRIAEHRSDDSQVYTTPEGINRFKPKAPGAYKLEMIGFYVSERALKFKKTYAKPGRWYYERTFFVHYGIGPNNAAYICNAMTFEDGRCPICDERGRLSRSPNEKDQNLADSLKPKQRQLFLIYNHAEPQKGVQLWDYSFHLFGKALDNKINNADEEDKPRFKKFHDPDEGLTMKLDATEESGGSGNKFLDFSVDQFRDRKEALDPDLFEHGICLDDLIIETPYDKLKKIFLQLDDEDDDDAKPKGKPGAKKPAADDDDDPPPRKKPTTGHGGKDNAEENDRKQSAADNAFSKGDDVKFEYKDKELEGTIVKVDRGNEKYHVQVEGKEKPNILDWDDDTIAAVDADDDPPPKKKPAPADDDDPKPKRKPVADDDDPPPKKRPKPDEDDDPPPPKKKPKPADEDDDPPPKKKPTASKKDDDWDD